MCGTPSAIGIHTSSVVGAATAAMASSPSQALLLTALPADHVRDAGEHGEARADRRRLVTDLAAAAAVIVVAVGSSRRRARRRRWRAGRASDRTVRMNRWDRPARNRFVEEAGRKRRDSVAAMRRSVAVTVRARADRLRQARATRRAAAPPLDRSAIYPLVVRASDLPTGPVRRPLVEGLVVALAADSHAAGQPAGQAKLLREPDLQGMTLDAAYTTALANLRAPRGEARSRSARSATRADTRSMWCGATTGAPPRACSCRVSVSRPHSNC